MLKRVVGALVVAGGVYMLVVALPDLVRYTRISRM